MSSRWLAPAPQSVFEEAHRTGAPILRPLLFEWPEDESTYAADDEFLVGPALLVAPIAVPGVAYRHVYLPRGAWDNAFESLLTFVRNEIARPNIGEHDADKHVPFLWTIFLFVLFNNLLGMLPFMGSATASIYVTGALAVVVFFAIHGSAIVKMGFVHYVESLWPHFGRWAGRSRARRRPRTCRFG